MIRKMLLQLIFIGFSLQPIAGHTHGGVGNEGNQCKMTIGPYQMLFTGYQPHVANKEFCDDIPVEGNTFVVLDHVEKRLREMPTDYRVMNDVNDLGIEATLEMLGSQQDIDDATVFYVEPKLYPTGTMVVNQDFAKGKYIGVVTVTDPARNKTYTSVFPFSVGYGEPWLVLGPQAIGYTIFLALFALVLVLGLTLSAKASARERAEPK
ncbi:MAG: hypothetical protein IMF06_09500 [Proteobacteria bacterium]|nr:hypothetical protein [Pseudomonadota bacterium]